jgi:hypothetical protein
MSWDLVTGGTAHAVIVVWLLALAVLPFFALVGIALHARYRSRLLEPDHPPLRDRELSHRLYDVKMVEGRRGHLPANFTYSPHTRSETPVLDAEPLPAPDFPSLSLEDLLRGPGVTYGQDVTTGQALSDDRVRSMLVGGVPGSGKTTFTTLLVAQLVHRGASVALGDPHAGNVESLANRLQALSVRVPTEEEPRRIREMVETAAMEIQARKHGAPSTAQVVVVVDELIEQVRLLGGRDRERMREALEILSSSGRKFSVSSILLSGSWTRAMVGGTAVRNLAPTAAIFKMRRDEALSMCGLTAEAWPSDPLSLPPGEAYLVGVGSDVVRIRVPSFGVRPAFALPSHEDAVRVHEDTANTPRIPNEDPTKSQILALLRRGVEPREVVRLVYGIEKPGASYTARLKEVWSVVSEQLRGG